MQPNPITTAPKTGEPICVYARWDWEQITNDGEYSWRVCKWENSLTFDYDFNEVGGFSSITSNPYKDYAADPRYWSPLPEIVE